MNNIVGQPVEGDDFFDREDDIANLWQDLRAGNHVVLLAPRRVGKTSLAIRAGAEASKSNWKFVLVDAQRDRDELSFLSNLFENLKSAGLKVPILARLTESVSSLRRSMKGKVEGFGMSVEVATDASKKAGGESAPLEKLVDKLFQELESSEDQGQVLITVDELPILLAELERADDKDERLRNFLNWFRSIRLRYRKNIRWLLLGSVGLDSFVESRHLTPTINDLQTTSLGAYSDDVAIDFLQTLARAKGLEISNLICREVIAQIGWPLPFFLQLVFQRVHSNLGRKSRTIRKKDITRAFEQLTSPDFYKHFEPWRGRLAEGLGVDEHKAAVAILNALCTEPQGLPRTSLDDSIAAVFPGEDAGWRQRLIAAVLGQLERDGYLLRDKAPVGSAARYAFRSFLLRQYWFSREVA